ncbi:MAG: aldehyde dehydrogenase family protein [Saprospiraceae bacterium]|nr:aldehyde dehydrogenase family protein [Saprospiraceae bacterium]
MKDEQAAINLANDSDYGLGGSVFTQDIERGKRVADQIDTGMVFINHPTWTQADLPFCGTKHSGFGRELSELRIQEFVNKKLIRVSDLNDPFWDCLVYYLRISYVRNPHFSGSLTFNNL